MNKILTAVLAATMLMPSTVLASSIRPGSTPIKARYKGPTCGEQFKEPCDVEIDETGVKGPEGHIVKVLQWSTKEGDFNEAGGNVVGAAGASVGAAAGMSTCLFMGPFCLIAAPAIMQTGMGAGAGFGGKGGVFFTVVGDDADGNRIIQKFKYNTRKEVDIASEKLLNTTKLVEGELRA